MSLKLGLIIFGVVAVIGFLVYLIQFGKKYAHYRDELKRQKAARKKESEVNEAAIEGLKREQEGFDESDLDPDSDLFDR